MTEIIEFRVLCYHPETLARDVLTNQSDLLQLISASGRFGGEHIELDETDIGRLLQHMVDVLYRSQAGRASIALEIGVRQRGRQWWTEQCVVGALFAAGIDRLGR